VAGERRQSAFHRFFAAAQWSRDALGLAVFQLIAPPCDGAIVVAIDASTLPSARAPVVSRKTA
jgi:hypothetical protein